MEPSSEKERNIKLPDKMREFYIEEEPDMDYFHASMAAYEAFRDMKFGVRIHWGLYSIWELRGESWPFLRMSVEKRQEYQQLYKNWNPIGFDADEWMVFFKRSGLRCLAFTTKHHEGFSMFDTQTRVKKRVNWLAPEGERLEDCDLAYSIMETPFKRDIVKEICDAARRADIKIDLYFSHPDWYDADFRPYSHHPVIIEDAIEHPENYDANILGFFSGVQYEMTDPPSPTESQRMMVRHRQQLIEILSNYGKIDMCCLDMRLGPANWQFLKNTIKTLRKIQPDVMFRNRGIGNYGDYYTPEGFVPDDPNNTNMPWMCIYPLGDSFSYEGDPTHHKGTAWIIQNLIDTCAKGGNFMVGIGPDGNGKYHPEAIKQLEAAGEWLKINGEGIYGTRPWIHWQEGDVISTPEYLRCKTFPYKQPEVPSDRFIRFTQTKNGKTLYIFIIKWPETQFVSKLVRPRADSEIFMLGHSEKLPWKIEENQLMIDTSRISSRPSEYAWTFKISLI